MLIRLSTQNLPVCFVEYGDYIDEDYDKRDQNGFIITNGNSRGQKSESLQLPKRKLL